MPKDRVVFISDVHIGTGARTNWYQRAVHEPMLLAALDYVTAQASSVAELVLLGDFVDQWSYLPDVRPPTFADIAAANPLVFGAGGALARALEALDGAVTFVNGNHDMSVSAADLATVRDRQGRSPRFETAFPYLPAAGVGQVACAHGHQFSLFNAPDWKAMPASGLPIGHIVTRIAALWSFQHLPDGESVADRPGAGEPTGWVWEKDELITAVADVVEHKDSLADLVVGALVRATGVSEELPIAMMDGSTVTVGDARTRLYPSLYTGFADSKRFPGSAYGDAAAFHALIGTDLHNTLDHFARALGKRHAVVVFGHTHWSRDDLQQPVLVGSNNVYLNSGFGCPARPDLMRADQPRRPTLAEVQIDAAARTISALVRVVEPGPPARVVDVPLHAQTIGW